MKLLEPRRRRVAPLVWMVIPALVLNLLAVWGMDRLITSMELEQTRSPSRQVRLMIMDPPPPREPEPEPEPVYRGQIVELVKSDDEAPEEADYLAETNHQVEEETKTKNFKVNPEVLSDQYSREEKMKTEDLVDVNVDQQSTGAKVGNERFDPDKHGALAALPSPWAVTNKDGFQAPTIASHSDAAMAGAPQNDKLDERISDRTRLNAREFPYAAYLNRIRRMVNFYWSQNIDNLPPSMVFSKHEYITVVDVVLDGDGALEHIEVTTSSGHRRLDDAVLGAFRLAAPFPNPPEGLISEDGRVHLDQFGFTLTMSMARARFEGVDPRANVQFPGILKAPR